MHTLYVKDEARKFLVSDVLAVDRSPQAADLSDIEERFRMWTDTQVSKFASEYFMFSAHSVLDYLMIRWSLISAMTTPQIWLGVFGRTEYILLPLFIV